MRRDLTPIPACAVVVASLVAPAAHAGPDVIISDLYETTRFGTINGITAYGIGTMACNIGDAPAAWNRETNQHPVIAQHLYRLKNGRFQQVGLSWVKHGFGATNGPVCGPCQPTNDRQQLMPNCADPYSAFLNGSQSSLGPRGQINAATGVFPFPVDYSGVGPAEPIIGRRLQVANTDLDPAQNADARYFIEAQYVTPDEPAFGTHANNSSFREVAIVNNAGAFSLAFIAGRPTQPQRPALEAWADIDPGVVQSSLRVPGDGEFRLSSRVIRLGPALWRYEYALLNLDSHRNAGGFRIPIVACAATSSLNYAGPRHHSGEPTSNSPWPGVVVASEVVWRTPEDFSQNANASALRWGTLANFGFDCDRPPTLAAAIVEFFAPGSPASITLAAPTPGFLADFNGDGFVDFFDFDDFVACFEGTACPSGRDADFNGDGFSDFFDFDDFVAAFEFGC